MATFARGYWIRQITITNTQRQHEPRHNTQTTPSKITWLQDPQDLRGIPAIGRNVGGAIPGTRPDTKDHATFDIQPNPHA